MVYDKYAYNKSYVFLVYMEFERRVNSTLEIYKELKTGECNFDYKSWETRLNISHKLLVNSIKILVENDYIRQTYKGKKGTQSRYILTRFLEQNLEQNLEQKKPSNTNGSKGTMEQNSEQKRVHTSIYNNLNIKSNNIYSSSAEEIWSQYPKKIGKAKAIKKLPALIKEYGQEQLLRCIERYSKEIEGRDKQFICNGDTFFNGRFMDYLDSNFIESEPKQQKIKKESNFDY
nr:MAG TPA_asm: putative replisome organizer protein [Caudoviricetes sp.]